MSKEQDPDKLYPISEVSKMTGVKVHVLRQWEVSFPQLSPRRLPSGKRAYDARDIKIVRRIKTMMKHDGMTAKGARIKLNQELQEVVEPRDLHGMRDLADRIADEARAIIGLFDDEDELEEEEIEEIENGEEDV